MAAHHSQRGSTFDPNLKADMSGDVIDVGTEPAAERRISDVETLKALSDPLRRVVLAKGLARLSPARAAEFQARLKDLVASFEDDSTDVRADEYRFVLGFYPLTVLPAEEPPADD